MFVLFSRERVLALAHLSATEHHRKTVYFFVQWSVAKNEKEKMKEKKETKREGALQLRANTETLKTGKARAPLGSSSGSGPRRGLWMNTCVECHTFLSSLLTKYIASFVSKTA